jgi:coenzyme F420-dependent glucose-6-phosphate dehydrogenase
MFRIGYKASAEQFTPRDLLNFGLAAELNAMDSVWISDHFQPWRHTGGHAPQALPWLGALGAMTKRIILGTSVLTPTFRYHPSLIAQAFGTLGSLFPGRIILGVGTGESLNEVPSTGVEWPSPGERLGRLKEAVGLIRAMWSEDRLSFDGKYYRVINATIYDKPDQPVPIYVAGAGPQVTQFAGKSADGFICTSGKKRELYTETLLPNLEAGLLAAGRAADAVDRMIEIKLSFDTDRQQALEDTRFWAALALSPEEKMAVEDPLEMERLADALPLERAAGRWIVTNDPEEVVDRVRPYVDMGFNHLVFHAPGHDQNRFLTLFGSQIAPRLRAVFG